MEHQNNPDPEMSQLPSTTERNTKATLQSAKAPIFNFPEQMQLLYDEDMDLPKEKIDAILALERKPLIEDLCRVFMDTIERFDAFNEDYALDEAPYTGFHVALLLAELKAKEALPTILEVMRQSEDYMDFWFGDCMGNVMTPLLYSCANENLGEILDYLKEPNLSPFIRCFATEAVTSIARVQPDRREEIVSWSRKALNFFAQNADDETITVPDLVGLFVADLIDAHLHELLPEIKALYELDVVELTICGTYKKVKTDIENPNYKGLFNGLHFIKQDIYGRYNDLSKLFERFEESYEPRDNGPLENIKGSRSGYPQTIVKEKKVGRNDPCPCGSGKKYKKCCM